MPARRAGRLLVALCCLPVLAACSSDAPDTGPTTPQESTATDSAAAPDGSASEGPDGTRTVSVASITLPGGPWTDEVSAATEDLDESHFALGATPQSATCAVTLSVQSAFDGTMESYTTFVEALNGEAAEISEDADAPAGTQGMVARIDRTGEDGNPFSSIIRTLLTQEGTKITMSGVAPGTSPDPACDLEAIAASLRWSGEDRPMGG